HRPAMQPDFEPDTLVEERSHALPRGQLAASVLLGDALGSAHLPHAGAARLELRDALAHPGARWQRSLRMLPPGFISLPLATQASAPSTLATASAGRPSSPPERPPWRGSRAGAR